MNYETSIPPADDDHTRTAPAAGGDSALIVEEDTQPKRRRTLWIALALLIVAAIVAAFMLSGGEEEQPFAPADDAALPAVTVLVPGSGTLQGVVNATGTLAARRELPVGAVGEGGRVVRVNVEAGDWVRAGQVLAVIDRSVQTQQASAQAAQIEVAQADANLAQSSLDRGLQLVDRGFNSTADIERLTAERDAAAARVRVARAQLGERQARNAQLNVVAPAAGLILTRDVETGQTVGPGSGALFTIAQGGEMELLARVGETDLARIGVGAEGTVTPAGSDQQFACQIWQKSPVIDEQTRQGTARCALSYDPALRPGGFATVALAGDTTVAPRLPESAILSDDQGSYVYIVDGEDTVVRRPVQVGTISDEGIAIAAGLTGSERVVLRAGGFLTAGDKVRPVAEAAR
ncbi:MAG: efflux RND transporter periplasmic adaptor subunit [Alteraurantiacibacter sp.]